jgi:hypothetical protein
VNQKNVERIDERIIANLNFRKFWAVQIEMMADLHGSPTAEQQQIRFFFARLLPEIMTLTKPNCEKKQREFRAFTAACDAGLPIVAENVDGNGEQPDLRVTTQNGVVGIELSEVIPLPRSASFNSSLAEAIHHEGSVSLAERIYNAAQDALPVTVTTYPWDIERTKTSQRKRADALARFVREHCHEASPVKLFNRLDGIPEGFGVVNICLTPGPWFGGKSCGVTLEGIHGQLSRRIEEKNGLLSRYRANLPNEFGSYCTVVGK